MRPRTLFALGVACLLFVVGASAQRGGDPGGGGQAGARAGGQRGGGGGDGLAGLLRGRGRGDQPTGTGVIRGRVTAQDTGAPVRRAQVRGTAGGAGVARLATTDAEGRFELRDLPAGQWSLQASKPGFVTQRLGQRRPFETVVPVDLQDGQQLASANFALARGGAITGRVFDDFGDPVANARVQVLRSQIVEGRRRLVQTGSGDETDDTGAFRLYGLAPGDYYVAATLRAGPQNFVAFNGGNVLDALGGGDRAGYAPTYFPGTGNVSEAQRISLGAGEETSVSFGLLPVRTVRISGTVVSASGTPPTNGAVILTAADTDEVGIVTPAAGQIQANGAFTIVNAVPGSYVLSVRTAGDGGGRGRGPLAGLRDGTGEVGILPITVGSEDMTGVTIVTTRGGSIEGTVVFEGGATRPRVDTLRVAARPIRASLQGLGGRASQSPVAANGTFTLSSLVGAMTLRVEGLPQQWVLKSVEAGGSDVTDTPLDLKGTEQLTGARITLTDKITEINGTATLGGGAAKDFSVIVFADDRNKWAFPTRHVRSTRGNQQGNFSIRGLPPTGYLAVALSHLEEGEAQDPEFLARLREQASSVSLREGETKTVELRVLER